MRGFCQEPMVSRNLDIIQDNFEELYRLFFQKKVPSLVSFGHELVLQVLKFHQQGLLTMIPAVGLVKVVFEE